MCTTAQKKKKKPGVATADRADEPVASKQENEKRRAHRAGYVCCYQAACAQLELNFSLP